MESKEREIAEEERRMPEIFFTEDWTDEAYAALDYRRDTELDNGKWVQLRGSSVWHWQRFSNPEKTYCGLEISERSVSTQVNRIPLRFSEVDMSAVCKNCQRTSRVADRELGHVEDEI